MLELMPAGQIDAAALAADNYFLSLLAAGAKQGILTDADLARLQSESLALLAAQTAVYTGGESSSVRTETAQALLDSVFYTLGIVLKGFPTPDAALQALKSRSLAVLLTEGQDGIRRRVTAARARHRRLIDALFETENVFYRTTAADGIRGFFRLYRPALFANETHITADYPPLLPITGLCGIEFIERYLACLMAENRFLRCFQPKQVHLLLCALPEDYRKTPMNLCLPVLTAALCCELTGQPPHTLACDREVLARLLGGKSGAQNARLLYGAFAPLCAALGISPRVRVYLRRVIPQIAAALTRAAQNGTLDAAVLYPSALPALTLSDSARMEDRTYAALLAALAACGDAAEKAALLKSRVRSRGDLLDVLHDAEWSSDDLAVLLAALSPASVAALCAVCPADGLSDDPQDIALAAALADYRNALAPSEVAQLDAAVRALRRGSESEI